MTSERRVTVLAICEQHLDYLRENAYESRGFTCCARIRTFEPAFSCGFALGKKRCGYTAATRPAGNGSVTTGQGGLFSQRRGDRSAFVTTSAVTPQKSAPGEILRTLTATNAESK